MPPEKKRVESPIEGLAVTVFLGPSEMKTGLSLQGGGTLAGRGWSVTSAGPHSRATSPFSLTFTR